MIQFEVKMENVELKSLTEHKSAFSEWTKAAILRLKNSNCTEKNELQRLNTELKTYLGNVQVLEELNNVLIAEVENEKKRSVLIFTDKSHLDEEIQNARVDLENNAVFIVEKNVIIEENRSSIDEMSERMRFFETEANISRKKIHTLTNELNEIEYLKDDLLGDVDSLEKILANEQDKIALASNDVEKLRKTLNLARSNSKKIEFQIETLKDDIIFRKEVHREELNEFRANGERSSVSNVQLDFFYKNELANAVKQIRQDFNTLNEQQLRDYKKHKEEELASVVSMVKEEQLFANEMKARRDQSRELESNETLNEFNANNKEIKLLQTNFAQKMTKLNELEKKFSDLKNKMIHGWDEQQSEIDSLKEQNASLLNEIDYWESYTRSKLENEIQTYRSILNCHLLMDNSANEASVMLKNLKVSMAKTNSSESDDTIETVEILRQIFNYFDWNRNGTINSSEFENIMKKLNVNISNDAYKQVYKDFDKDGNMMLILSSFTVNSCQ